MIRLSRSGRCLSASLKIAAVVLASVLGNANVAVAQQIQPIAIEPDINGVDLLSGKILPQIPVLQIPAAPNLRLETINKLQPFLTGFGALNTTEMNFRLNNGSDSTSDSFTCGKYDEPDRCTSDRYNGASFFRQGDGPVHYWEGGTRTYIKFDVLYAQTAISAAYYPSTKQFADGELLTFYYSSHFNGAGTVRRPSRITSSIGYEMKFLYQSNVGGQAGWGVLSQATIYKSDNLSTPLARHSYSGSTITDLAGRQWVCSGEGSSGCGNALTDRASLRNMTVKLPEQSANSVTATAASRNYTTSSGGTITHSNWITQVVRDGMTWNYSYEPLSAPGKDPYKDISKVTISGPEGYSKVVEIGGSYDFPTYVKSIRDSQGKTTSYGYDAFIRPTRVTFPEGNSISVAYDFFGNITEQRLTPKTNATAALVQKASYPSCNPEQFNGSFECFRPTWTEDAKSNRTDYTWNNSHGGMLSQLFPVDGNGQRRKVKYTYSTSGPSRVIKEELCATNSAGTELTCGTANSFVKQTTYLGSTRLPLTETITNGVGSSPLTTNYSYFDDGRLKSQDGPLPGDDDATFFRYDLSGRQTWQIGPKGEAGYRSAIRTTYRNADDQVAKIEAGRVNTPSDTNLVVFTKTDTAYNTRRLPVSSTVSAATGTPISVTQASYDARNREDCTATRMNPAIFASLPASACSLGTQGAHGPDRIGKTIYDTESRPVKIQRAVGTSLQQDYATYTYTDNGKQASMIDARGYRAEMRYDAFDRQSHWYFPSRTATNAINPGDYELYGYDANGNRTSLRKRDGSILTYAYDKLNQMTLKTVPERAGLAATHSRDVHYQYDIRGLPTRSRFDSQTGEGITDAYDIYGRQTSSSQLMNGRTRTLLSSYDVGSRREWLRHTDGRQFSYSYHPDGSP